jgi:glycosyltransferase involved in cell wall biosynthesis
LYLDHVAIPSGGELALARLVAHLDRDLVTPIVVFGADGPMVDALRALEVETHVVVLDDKVRNLRKDDVGHVGGLQGMAGGLTAYIRRLCRFARSQSIDVLHTNSMKAHLYGGVAGRLLGLPVVWHLRDYVDRSYLPPKAVLGVRGAARVLPTGLIAVSHSVLASVRLAPSALGWVVHDGLSEDQLRPRAATDGEAPWSAPVSVGMVGRISPWKGQHIFLEAAAQVVAAGHDARFVIVGAPMFGEDSYLAQLRSQVQRLQIGDRVEFRGFRPDVDMAEFNVLVHASTSADPFPNTVLEGMAAGLPVVASRGGGVPEMLEHGVSGCLSEMGSAVSLARNLEAILSDPVSARRLGDEAYAQVRDRFTAPEAARRVEAFYRQLGCPRERRPRLLTVSHAVAARPDGGALE